MLVFEEAYGRVAFEKAPQNFLLWVSLNFASFLTDKPKGLSVAQSIESEANASIRGGFYALGV